MFVYVIIALRILPQELEFSNTADKVTTWGITDTRLLKSTSPILVISTSSTKMVPSGSASLISVANTVLFPAPVLPTIPT